ncbi:MerC domain-containing protein [Novosphingobium sp. BL-8H]|uniref:MerC domain-containing protein n=1 Tax=Novosphingobium sp. BL-8H TaxID=3127640 RepID=UPI003756C98B
MEGPMLKIDLRNVADNWLDGAATCASAACLVHCLVLPLVIALLPTLAGSLDPGEGFHTLILLFAVPTSALALVPGWRRGGAIGPLAAGVVGLFLLSAGVVVSGGPILERVVTVAGSLLLAGAHIANWRMRRTACSAQVRGSGGCSC